MDALRCDYCGGHINPRTYKCEYCGTQYVKPKDPYSPFELKVVSVPAPVETLGMKMAIPMEQVKDMERMGMPVEKYVRREFANQIAENIAGNIEIYDDFRIDSYEKVYSARLRVVRPDFRF